MCGVVVDTNVLVHLYETLILGEVPRLDKRKAAKLSKKVRKLAEMYFNDLAKTALLDIVQDIRSKLCVPQCYVADVSRLEFVRVFLRKLYDSEVYRSRAGGDSGVVYGANKEFDSLLRKLGDEIGLNLKEVEVAVGHLESALDFLRGCSNALKSGFLRRISRVDLSLVGLARSVGGHVLTLDRGLWELDYKCAKRCESLSYLLLRGDHVLYVNISGESCP